MKNAVDEGLNFRKVGTDRIGITVDERTRPDIIEAVWRAFGGFDLVYPKQHPAYRLPEKACSPISLSDPSRVPYEPGRIGDDPLYAPVGRS